MLVFGIDLGDLLLDWAHDGAHKNSFIFLSIYKKGELRCLFDKMTSQVLKWQAQQKEVWNPADSLEL